MSALLVRYGGETAALSAAALWAFAALFYRRASERIPAPELNLIKGVLAIFLLSATYFVTEKPHLEWDLHALALLGASGIIGIGLGDTAYFEALKTLGVRRTLLLGILAPPLTALLAWSLFEEGLPFWAWVGIGLTLCGVAWVITERANGTNAGLPKCVLWKGTGFGLAAALAQSIGALLSRIALTQTEVGALMSAILRLAAGVLIMLVWITVKYRPQREPRPRKVDGRLWGIVFLAVFMGTYLGVWLQQVAIQFAPVGTAQTLLATSQLFILPLAALRGERISVRAILGAAVAIAGVALLFRFK